MPRMEALLVLLCVALMWLAHALGSWRVAWVTYPLPAVAAWQIGVPWLAAVMTISAAGLFVRALRRS